MSRDYETSNSLDPQEGRAEGSCPAFKRAESAESAGPCVPATFRGSCPFQKRVSIKRKRGHATRVGHTSLSNAREWSGERSSCHFRSTSDIRHRRDARNRTRSTRPAAAGPDLSTRQQESINITSRGSRNGFDSVRARPSRGSREAAALFLDG